jgi:putative glutamine amidotransferase
MQTINMATGGSMYQDIPSELYQAKYVEDVLELESDQQHKNYWQNLFPDDQMIWSNFHSIRQVNNHHFFDDQLWKHNPTPVVYSSHHQSVKKTGLNIEIIATSMDEKVPEIIAHKIYKNVFGVQFHPEVSSLYHVNGTELKWFPDDSLRQTYYSHLQNSNSMYFHMKLWEKIEKLF